MLMRVFVMLEKMMLYLFLCSSRLMKFCLMLFVLKWIVFIFCLFLIVVCIVFWGFVWL